jgi:hypothetical protein
VGNGETAASFLEHVQRAVAKIYSYMSVRIKGFGKKLAADIRVEEVEVAAEDFLVVELRSSKEGKWFL